MDEWGADWMAWPLLNSQGVLRVVTLSRVLY
jgi:hypothetical protein